MNSTPSHTAITATTAMNAVAITASTSNQHSDPTSGHSNRAPQILEEDVYTEAVSKIVERDYFPTLSAMKQYERRLNVELATLKGTKLPTELLNSPHTNTIVPIVTPSTVNPVPKDDTVNISMPLDAFQSKYTTEDNDSYPCLMERAQLEHEQKYAWMYKAPGSKPQLLIEQGDNKDQKLLTLGNENNEKALIRRTNVTEYGQPQQTIRYEVKNSLITTQGSSLLQNDRGAPKQVCAHNTRLPDQIEKALGLSTGQEADPLEIRSQADTPLAGNYRLVDATPTIDPNEVDNAPMMTWGSIEGTPALLQPAGNEQGYQTPRTYHIPPTPKRDVIGRRLSERTGKRSMANSGGGGGVGSSRSFRHQLSSMSPAAAHLRSNILSQTKSPAFGGDAQLRASYASSRTDRDTMHVTPRFGGNTGGRSTRAHTPYGWSTGLRPSDTSTKTPNLDRRG
ncbi:nuclear protein Es2-domain-containing protein [Syncephalis fuscata]|nr:nuclear protein Es2-domain-containing protein [Syncephalis fuscata]